MYKSQFNAAYLQREIPDKAVVIGDDVYTNEIVKVTYLDNIAAIQKIAADTASAALNKATHIIAQADMTNDYGHASVENQNYKYNSIVKADIKQADIAPSVTGAEYHGIYKSTSDLPTEAGYTITKSQTQGGSSLGTITVTNTTFLNAVSHVTGSYVFVARGYPTSITIAEVSGITPVLLEIIRLPSSDDNNRFAWKSENDERTFFTDTRIPVVGQTAVYDSSTGETPIEAQVAVVSQTGATEFYWVLNNNIVDLTTYGISFTGTVGLANEITVVVSGTSSTEDVNNGDTALVYSNKTLTKYVASISGTTVTWSEASPSKSFGIDSLNKTVPIYKIIDKFDISVYDAEN